MGEKDLREELAEYAHDAWAGWMSYLFSKGDLNPDGTFTIHHEETKRWIRQSCTSYESLPHHEKESDRAEADKMIAIMQDAA